MFEGFQQELKRPATAVAAVLAFIGLFGGAAFSLFFYYKSIRSAEIYYSVQQVQAFDQRSISQVGGDDTNPLRIVDQSGNPVRNNIYAANITIWNGGNDELRKEDVRSAYKIIVQGEPSFYNLIMYAQTNGNRDKFRLVEKNTLSWDHFDPGEGFKLRLLYAGDKELQIELDGAALNTSTSVEVNRRDRQFGAQFGKIMLYLVGATFLCILLYSMLQSGTVRFEKLGKEYTFERGVFARIIYNLFEKNLILIPLVVTILAVFLPAIILYFLRVPAPPFG